MTEKIVIMQGQMDGINAAVSNLGRARVLEVHARHADRWFGDNYKHINRMDLGDMARILYEPNSYEVEELYKKDEWVIMNGFTLKIMRIQYENERVQYRGVSNWQPIKGIDGHATPEEIRTEKDRQKWAKVEPGDVIIETTTGRIGILTEIKAGYLEIKQEIGDTSIRFWNTMHCELYAKKEGEGE